MHSIEGFFKDLKSNNEHAASMQRTDKFSQFRSTIWSVWPNGLVFVYKLSSLGSSPLAVTYISDIAPVSSKEFLDIKANIVWIHPETRT